MLRRFGVGFQPPPPRTERADFQHSALLPASRPSLWDVSRRERFRSWFYPTPTPRLADLFRLPLAVYPLTSGPADYWAFLSCAPASPTAMGTAWQQGSFAPRTLLRYSEPIRHRLAVSHFPGFAGYMTTLLHRFRGGTRTVSPVAWPALVTVLSLMPRRNVSSLQSVCDDSCCLRPTDGGSASGAREFRGHLWVHLRYGPVTRSPSFMMALSVGFDSFPPRMRPKLRGF